MSNVDGTLTGFRSGRDGFHGQSFPKSRGNACASVQYTVAIGAAVGPVALALTLVGTDALGTLSGGNAWLPKDLNARYLVTLDIQTTAAGVGQYAITKSDGTILLSGQTPASSHLTLVGNGIDFATVGTGIQAQCINSATNGTFSGLANANLLTITKLDSF